MSAIQKLNGELADAAGAVKESLVGVRKRYGGGAGIVWREDGLVITNAHVAHRGSVAISLPDGREVPGEVVAADPDIDLAAVRIPAGGLIAAPVGDSRAVRPGQLVFAHGHPWGVRGIVTSGVIIGVGADWPGLPAVNGAREWLVLNMRLRPGNSGGPILDVDGRVIGIAAVMAGPSVGMAVPSHVVQAFVEANVPRRSPAVV